MPTYNFLEIKKKEKDLCVFENLFIIIQILIIPFVFFGQKSIIDN